MSPGGAQGEGVLVRKRGSSYFSGNALDFNLLFIKPNKDMQESLDIYFQLEKALFRCKDYEKEF